MSRESPHRAADFLSMLTALGRARAWGLPAGTAVLERLCPHCRQWTDVAVTDQPGLAGGIEVAQTCLNCGGTMISVEPG